MASMQSGSPKVRIVPKRNEWYPLLIMTNTMPSPGGQFLRAYIERYNDPPVRNLITFGSQHMGVSDIPPCKPYDLPCNLARNALRAGVYSEWAQQNLVQVKRIVSPSIFSAYITHTTSPMPLVGK
jgi:palmitoyl-protein thioesterase